MKIGIDGSRAFIKNRTGIEEYSYRVIKNLRKELVNSRVVLYLRKNQKIDFDLPTNWKVKKINWPRLWTQMGLSLEMIFHPVDTLFIPAHTVPWKHPKNTVVTIHGLEYEICPKAYSFWERLYMCWSIKNSCRWAKRIISVSQNTKKDLIELYSVSSEKIEVIYEGCEENYKLQNPKDKLISNEQISIPYLFFVGRLEERKNILGMIAAFEILKEKYQIPHKLVLAGKFGHGGERIKEKIQDSKQKGEIILKGFVGEEEKFGLFKNADVFLFPTFYEGFGIPILEAQNQGTPVVTSNISSIPEVTGDSALLVDPKNSEEIAEATYKIISDENIRKDLSEKGFENVKRFSWEKCAREIAEIL